MLHHAITIRPEGTASSATAEGPGCSLAAAPPISWSQAQPGDLVFYSGDTHVGIVGGWDESGNIEIIHGVSGQNNVVITGKAGFTTIGRPDYYG